MKRLKITYSPNVIKITEADIEQAIKDRNNTIRESFCPIAHAIKRIFEIPKGRPYYVRVDNDNIVIGDFEFATNEFLEKKINEFDSYTDDMINLPKPKPFSFKLSDLEIE